MTKRKLNDAHQEQLIVWLGMGYTTDQINEMAAKLPEPFPMKISPQLNSFYRREYAEKIETIRKEVTDRIFSEGLALASERVKRLIKIAEALEADLHEKHKIWLADAKGIGSGEQYEKITFETFNAAEIKELRAAYDDIAKETGGRISKVDLTSKGKMLKGYVGISPEDWEGKAEPPGTEDE